MNPLVLLLILQLKLSVLRLQLQQLEAEQAAPIQALPIQPAPVPTFKLNPDNYPPICAYNADNLYYCNENPILKQLRNEGF